MLHNSFWRPLVAGLLGLIVGAVATSLILGLRADDGHFHFYDEEEGGYHIHADFLVMVNGTKVDLTLDTYQSTAEKILHPGVHLHDNKDNVIHFHARNISLLEFLSSLDITLTNECLTINDEAHCTNDTNSLLLYVNNENYNEQIETYVPIDDDSILLYYGSPTNPDLENFKKEITDDACLYTGTCPERGTPPPEECGLTCEL